MSQLPDPFKGKPIIALDFDGVIHQYSGWNGGKLNEPIPGAKEAIVLFVNAGFRVVVFSTRDENMIKPWLQLNDFPELEVCSEKPPAVVMLDDRALTFDGVWTPELIARLASFKPYWEQ